MMAVWQGERESGHAGVLDPMSDNLGSSPRAVSTNPPGAGSDARRGRAMDSRLSAAYAVGSAPAAVTR